ncbi:MAG: N-acyl-D-amino-acid deacylase family protein [Planctomycetota bacterium]|jgi:N-acyl-D-aspartate/D-glutamate deacylase
MSATSLLLLTLALLPQDEVQPAVRGDFDVLIVGGSVHDGSGGKVTRVDVAINGDRIAAIGDLSDRTARLRIDASGMVVCPGFVDLHNHGDKAVFNKKLRQNLCYLTQGCTTIVTGNCGGGQLDVASYFKRLDKQGCGVNVAHLIPQGALRRKAMGGSFDRPPTEAELQKMRDLVRDGMEAGAFGMSTGLIYTPGAYAETGEIAALAKVVAKHGGIYASHIRNEGDRLLAAVEEAIAIGEAAGCPVHLSHFKASKPPNWGKVKQSCALVEAARARGMRVTCDQYPYRASSTSLAALTIPTWAREGSNKDLVKRFDDAGTGPKIRMAISRNLEQRGGADQILIAHYKKNTKWNGLNLMEAAASARQAPVDLIVGIQRNGGCSAVAFSMCDEDVDYIMRKPYVATASDGSSKMKGPTRPHPRSYGTFPRKIGVYAIERKVIGLRHAIRSSTGLPADVLGLEDRGYLRKGAFADVVVFDPRWFRDKATFVDPHQHSEGALWVFVNGIAAIADGKPTGKLGGRVVRDRKQKNKK